MKQKNSVVGEYVQIEQTELNYKQIVENVRENSNENTELINNTLRILIESSALAVVGINKNQKITIWNDAAESILGWKKADVLNKYYREVFNNKSAEPSLLTVFQLKQKFSNLELKSKRKDGNMIDVSFSAAPLLNEAGNVIGSIGLYADISNSKEVETRVNNLAFYDQLTKLPNRTLFKTRLNYGLSQCKRNQKKLAILYIDIDRFKDINDSLGHNAGDKLLIEVGKRLQSTVRQTDTVSRLGGDEFALILTEIDDPADAALVAEKIIKVLSKPIILDEHHVFITPSIGISIYPIDSLNEEDLLMYADVAMYASKHEGKNRYNYFTSGMNAKVFEKMLMYNSLRFALERNEFELYYQPKVNLLTGKIRSMEALVRWHHPEFGLISPTVFIPIAEETGLMEDIDAWILRTACSQTKKWHDLGMNYLCIAVNISFCLFRRNLADLIKSVLNETGLPASSLEIEITETNIMNSDNLVITMLSELRRIGILISVDDFGTGYSSLGRLTALPVDTLKIDQSFISDLNKTKNSQAIVKSIIAIGKSLQLNVIAEGVETLQQADFLCEHDCPNIQGYYISPPVTGDKFVKLLRKKFKVRSLNKVS